MAEAQKSKILIIGGTGYTGKYIVEASVKAGHPTSALVRKSAVSDPVKWELLENFKQWGVTLIFVRTDNVVSIFGMSISSKGSTPGNMKYGDIFEHDSLVKAIKQAEVVISTISYLRYEDQGIIISTIKEAGNIKRFFPSEFGMDVDRNEPTNVCFANKAQTRRAVEAAGIPHTYVCCSSYGRYFLTNFYQLGATEPPRDKVQIPGDGNAEAIYSIEADVAAYTIKIVDDPRTLNKILYVRHPSNIYSFNDLVSLWEKKIGKVLERSYLPEEQILKNIQEASFPDNVKLSIAHAIFVKGEQTNFNIDPSLGMEAHELYADVKYTTVDEFLNQFL